MFYFGLAFGGVQLAHWPFSLSTLLEYIPRTQNKVHLFQ